MGKPQKITGLDCVVEEEFNFSHQELVKDIAFLKKEVRRLVDFKHKKENEDASLYSVLTELVALLPTLYALRELLEKEPFVTRISLQK